MTSDASKRHLPGEEHVQRGLEQLRRGDEQVEMFLVLLAASALRRAQVEIPPSSGPTIRDPHLRLYAILQEKYGDGAHGKYNALLREVDSFVSAAEALSARRTDETS